MCSLLLLLLPPSCPLALSPSAAAAETHADHAREYQTEEEENRTTHSSSKDDVVNS